MEVQRIVDNIMDAMMDMRLRLPVAVVEHLTGGIDDAIQKLTTNVLYHVGSADVLVPPVPPLTRCVHATSIMHIVIIQKLTTDVRYHVGSADVLMLPVPPLTQ